MYTVIGTPKSRTFRVLWMLEELAMPYEHLSIFPRSDAVTKQNPSGKIPVLMVKDQALTDSTAILQYLADYTGKLTFPAGSIARGQQDGVTQFLLDEFDASLWTAARHSFVLPEEHRMPAIKDSLKWEYARSLTRLAEKLGNSPFLTGESITVPDIIAGHCGRWAKSANFPQPDGPLAEYFNRLWTRPAYQAVAGM